MVIVIITIMLVVVRRPSERVAAPAVTPTGVPAPEQQKLDKAVSEVFLTGDPTECQDAGTRPAIDQCYFRIATSRYDIQLCEYIFDVARKTRCQGLNIAKQVADGGDPELCVSIVDTDARHRCLIIAVENGVDEDFCGLFSGEESVNCSDEVNLLAGQAGDSSACAAIINEDLREECYPIEEVQTPAEVEPRIEAEPAAPTDSDNDGLTDEEEEQYGTDPNNPDTDGDGFDDLTEIEGGYNPLGPGRL